MNYNEEYLIQCVDNNPQDIWGLINDVRDKNFCNRKQAVKYVVDVLYNNNRGHIVKYVAKHDGGWTHTTALILCIFMPPWAMILMEGKIFSFRIFISCILFFCFVIPSSIQAFIYYFVNRKYWPFWAA